MPPDSALLDVPPPPYNPNLTLGDFTFTPNVTLIVVGGALLLVALILRGK